MKASLFEVAGATSKSLVQIAADVDAVEKALNQQMDARVQVVENVLRHTLEAGGKRLRPVFLILSARATGRQFDRDRAILLGACMEMIHMATLIHDDFIDESPTRRGRPTAATIFGSTASILSGDVLLAKAMEILAQDGDIQIIRTASRMVVEMAEGEAREVEARGDYDLSREEHLRILRMKTAAFVECCCMIGGQVAGAGPQVVDALGQYGHHLGIAFQLADDLLDYRGKTSETGKAVATDFREGCATLPLIELRASLSAEEHARVRSAFGRAASQEELATVIDLMKTRGAFDRAKACAEEHLRLAMAALDRLPDNSHRDLLRAAGQFVLQRKA